jgi:hypothetical protein
VSLVSRLFYGAIALACGLAGAYLGFRFTIYVVGVPIGLAYPHDGQDGLAVGMIALLVGPLSGIAVAMMIFRALSNWHGRHNVAWDE